MTPPPARAEVVVVGSGAGGSAAALALASAGLDVVVLEAGPRHDPATFSQREEDMLPALYREAGTITSSSGDLRLLLGRGVGGSTVPGLGVHAHPGRRLLARWAEERGLPGLAEDLERELTALVAELGLHQLEAEELSDHDRLFQRGCRAAGLPVERVLHARQGCVGCGFCALGCAYRAKGDAGPRLLARAEALGARVVPGCTVTRVRHRFGRVSGVSGSWSTPGHRPQPLSVAARAVVLAAGATVSPALVRASGLGDRWRQVGRGLHLHPSVALTATFNEPVESWRGIPHGVISARRPQRGESAPRTWLAPLPAHPAELASELPGVGPDLAEHLARYRYLARGVVTLRDLGPSRLRTDRRGRGRVVHRLDESDARALAAGIADLATAWLSAGARRVLVPTSRPVLVSSLAEAAVLRDILPRPLDPLLSSRQPTGGLCLAADPRRGSCDGAGRYHGARGLFVADGSLLPSALGGPAQLTILALGRLVGQAVADILT